MIVAGRYIQGGCDKVLVTPSGGGYIAWCKKHDMCEEYDTWDGAFEAAQEHSREEHQIA